MKKKKRLPCPFCGDVINEPECIPQADGSLAYMIQCCNCNLTMVGFEIDKLVDVWNYRAKPVNDT